MGVPQPELTLKEEIAEETRKLRASGVSEFLASIQAAVNVSKRKRTDADRRAHAMASHCVEP